MSALLFNTYFMHKNVLINWERVIIPNGARVFKIVNHFNLYNESYVVIAPIDKLTDKIICKEILVKLYDIKSITLV